MEKERRKELRAQYDQRKPEMGVVCLKSGERRWIAVSTDAKADYNGILFQLKLGSWPGRELQKAFTEAPDSFDKLSKKSRPPKTAANFPSYFTKMLVNTQSIACAFCFI